MNNAVLLTLVLFGFCICSSCVVHYLNLSKTWADAHRYCSVKYKSLATIGSMSDIRRLKRPSLETSFLWIGLSDDPKSWKQFGRNDANSWRWSATGNTSITDYQDWQQYEPNYAYGSQTCVMVDHDGKWNDYFCLIEYQFICYKETLPAGRKTYTQISIGMKWIDARDHCREHHTDLAMIQNAEENTAMLSVKTTAIVWIGLFREPWRWSDGSSITFENWDRNEENSEHFNQHCVAETLNHLWKVSECNQKFAFWCQGELKVKRTMVRMKIQTDADLSDPATNNQILQQLGAVLNKMRLTDFKLAWKIQP